MSLHLRSVSVHNKFIFSKKRIPYICCHIIFQIRMKNNKRVIPVRNGQKIDSTALHLSLLQERGYENSRSNHAICALGRWHKKEHFRRLTAQMGIRHCGGWAYPFSKDDQPKRISWTGISSRTCAWIPCVMACNPFIGPKVLISPARWADKLWVPPGLLPDIIPTWKKAGCYIVTGMMTRKMILFFFVHFGNWGWDVLRRCIFPSGDYTTRMKFLNTLLIRLTRKPSQKEKRVWKSAIEGGVPYLTFVNSARITKLGQGVVQFHRGVKLGQRIKGALLYDRSAKRPGGALGKPAYAHGIWRNQSAEKYGNTWQRCQQFETDYMLTNR